MFNLVKLTGITIFLFPVLQESDEDSPEPEAKPKKVRSSFNNQSPGRANRFSRSSLSENCSSPNEPEDYRPGFNDNDGEETVRRPSFQGADNSFYNKTSDNQGEYEGYSSKYLGSFL